MGNAYAYRGRLTPALILVALVALVVVALGMVAGPAKATSTFSTCAASCHNYSMGDAFHQKTTHSNTACGTCHDSGPAPSACASATCHGAASGIIAAQAQHGTAGCGTTAGCHGVAPGVVTTTMTAKVAPTSVKVKKSVKVTGTAGPADSLAGAKVAFKVERKVGTKWVKMKTGSATVMATGAFTWSYKTTKKGSHHVIVSIAKSSTYTAKSMTKTFKVK